MVSIRALLVHRQELVERETEALNNLVGEIATAHALLESHERSEKVLGGSNGARLVH